MKRLLLYIGYDFGREIEEELILHQKANSRLSGLIYSGKILPGLENVYGDSWLEYLVFPAGWWPRFSKKLRIRGLSSSEKRKRKPSYCNIVGLKADSIYRSLKRDFTSLLRDGTVSSDDELDIFVSETKRGYLKFAKYVKSLCPASKIIADVQDVPGINYEPLRGLSRFKVFDDWLTMSLLKRITDAYVLLSPFMMDEIKQSDKPFIVSEGICSPVNREIPQTIRHSIVYTGSLVESRCNASILIEAFKLIKATFPDARLLIAGSEPNEAIVKAKNMVGFTYLGNVSPEEAKKVQRSAEVLVNLRSPNPKFKYAFPSKLTDYLSAGKPIISSALDFLPVEYTDVVFVPDSLTAEGVASKIDYIFRLKDHELMEIGAKAINLANSKDGLSFGKNVKSLFDSLRS